MFKVELACPQQMNAIFAGKRLLPLHLACRWSRLSYKVREDRLISLLRSHSYCSTPILLKDKSFKDSSPGPRKSKFADTKQAKLTVVRSDEEKTKLKEEREQREKKKAEVRERQLAIQAKRIEDEKKKQVKTIEKEKAKSKRAMGDIGDD